MPNKAEVRTPNLSGDVQSRRQLQLQEGSSSRTSTCNSVGSSPGTWSSSSTWWVGGGDKAGNTPSRWPGNTPSRWPGNTPSRWPGNTPSRWDGNSPAPSRPSVSKSGPLVGPLVRSESLDRPATLKMRYRRDDCGVSPESTKGSTPRNGDAVLGSFWKNCQLACLPRITGGGGHNKSLQNGSRSLTIKNSSFKDGVRMLWADKYRPMTLDSFDIHYDLAVHLRHLTSQGICPHLLFQGPPGSGKRSLASATIRGVFGLTSCKVNNETRRFRKRDDATYTVLVPIYSSSRHVEVNLRNVGGLDYEVLTTIAREMTAISELVQSAPDDDLQVPYFKVLLLLNAQILSADAWQYICRTMEKVDSLKFILCCDGHVRWMSDAFAKSPRQVITVRAPSTEEVVKVLKKTVQKENLSVPEFLALRIARQSNHNMRKALVALEACHGYQYPLMNDQAIYVDWEEDIVQVAYEILSEQTPRRLHQARGKLQLLLANCIPPTLILQRLVEEVIRIMGAQLRREVCYWAAIYEQRMPSGVNAIFKLEEFVARFMSIYKANFVRPLP